MFIHILFKIEYHLWCAGSCDWNTSNSGITKLQKKKRKERSNVIQNKQMMTRDKLSAR